MVLNLVNMIEIIEKERQRVEENTLNNHLEWQLEQSLKVGLYPREQFIMQHLQIEREEPEVTTHGPDLENAHVVFL
jgi:hypothetical protein